MKNQQEKSRKYLLSVAIMPERKPKRCVSVYGVFTGGSDFVLAERRMWLWCLSMYSKVIAVSFCTVSVSWGTVRAHVGSLFCRTRCRSLHNIYKYISYLRLGRYDSVNRDMFVKLARICLVTAFFFLF